ncbi:YncE family protein [Corynebacterium matruchotii]|uniref:YncE family protein n=1 Tax=Corynebacterium matruchotii TaxID=43768 RepID=UPI0028F0CF08|nr:YncE family protein [Corynebacterium matruchotii]
MKKNLLPKTASQRAIAGLTSLALVAGGLTVMPYAGAQDETAEPVVATAEPNNDAAAEEAAPTAEAAAPAAAAEDEALPEGAAAVALANAPQGGATLPTGPAKGFVSGTAAGSEVDFQAFELKEGDKVTSVGTEHVNWLRKDQSVNAIANADGQVTIKGVQIPADAKTGDHIYFTYLAKAEDYKEYEVMLDATVTSSTETINVDQYTGAKRTLLTTLTQSAFDPASKYIFATRVSFEDGTYTIYKLDAKTLDVVAKNDIEERYAADGIAVDNKGQVWVTNSETGTVSVFKQSDLTHVKTFSQQELPGVKSIVIDNQTDLGYVGGPGGVITVLDINQNKPIGTIALDGFDEVTSLALDQRTNQLIATSGESANPQVAKVDLANGKKVDRYEVKGAREVSGAAYDPVSKNIFVATNESVITVINSETEKVVTTIDTGSGTSDVRYNPKDQRVYAVNTGAGTLSVIDPATNKAVAKLEVGSSPVHVSVASDGTVSVVNNASKDIGAVGQPVDEIYTFKYNAPTPPPPPTTTSESTTQKPTEKPKPTDTTKPNPPAGSGDLSSKLGKYRTILIAIFSVLGLTGIIAGAVAAMAHANMIPKEWCPPQFR